MICKMHKSPIPLVTYMIIKFPIMYWKLNNLYFIIFTENMYSKIFYFDIIDSSLDFTYFLE